MDKLFLYEISYAWVSQWWVSVMCLMNLSYAIPVCCLSYESQCYLSQLRISQVRLWESVLTYKTTQSVLSLRPQFLVCFDFWANNSRSNKKTVKKIVGILLNFGLTFDKRKQPRHASMLLNSILMTSMMMTLVIDTCRDLFRWSCGKWASDSIAIIASI